MLDGIEKQTTPEPEGPTGTIGFIEKYKKYFLPTLVTLAVIVAAALVVIFFFSRGESPVLEGDARLTISAPNDSVSGSEISFEILVENVSNTDLTEVGLELFYPSGFEYVNHTQTGNVEESRGTEEDLVKEAREIPRLFKLSDLGSDQTHKIVVVGRLSGSIQEIKSVRAVLRYVPQNFRSTFQKEAQVSTVMLAPNLTLNLRGPSRVFAGQTAEYLITVENQSRDVFEDVVVRLEDNPDFQFVGSNPPVITSDAFSHPGGSLRPIGSADSIASLQNESKMVWLIERIDPDQEVEIAFSGRLSQTLTGEVLLRVEQFLPGANKDEKLSAGRSFVFTSVLSSPLRLTKKLGAQGRFSQGEIYTAGDVLEFEINYDNQGITSLRNVLVSLEFDQNIYDFSRLRNTKGTGQRQGNSVQWIPGANPDLRLITPGQSGTFRITLPILAALEQNRITNPLVKGTLIYRSDEFPDGVATDAFEEKVGTEADLSVTKSVLSQDKDETRYLVVVRVENTVNDLAGSVFSATFPGLNTFVDFDSAQPVQERNSFIIDEASGIIRWDLRTLPALSEREISFELTTTSETLLRDLVFEGKDVFTGEDVVVREADLRER